ncbi:MAG: M56 family metallopeptidase, partial [Pirellulaceae bacterium]
TEEERRAVLAHELAHVRRRDFVAWWIAQLALALYWYHPGMHQLVRRLQLQQEIAADALAVMTTQDPHRYLKVLAAMWLRHDDFLIAGLAQRFLATTSTFSTRIAMLRVKDGPSTPGISRWLRNCIIAVSAGSTLLTATFRTGAADERPSSELTRPAASDISPAAQSNLRDAGTTPTVPVPSSRVPLGVLVVRPAQFFRLAGTEPWLSPLNREIAAALRDMTEGNIEAHADYVEEAVLLVRYDARLRPNGDRHSLSFELESLQAARGVDVAACFQRVFPGAVTKRGAQATIHLAPPSDGALNFLAQAGAGDARRMAFVEYAPQHVACRGMKPDEAEAYAAGERHWQSSTSAFPDWPRLEASTLRFALNDQLGRIAENADPDDPWQSAMQPLLQKTSQILGTIDLAPELSVQIDIQPRAETSVKQLEDTVADILARARAWASVPDPAADASSSADPSTAPSAMPANSYMETVRAVIQSARVESSAERIRITARAALPSN